MYYEYLPVFSFSLSLQYINESPPSTHLPLHLHITLFSEFISIFISFLSHPSFLLNLLTVIILPFTSSVFFVVLSKVHFYTFPNLSCFLSFLPLFRHLNIPTTHPSCPLSSLPPPCPLPGWASTPRANSFVKDNIYLPSGRSGLSLRLSCLCGNDRLPATCTLGQKSINMSFLFPLCLEFLLGHMFSHILRMCPVQGFVRFSALNKRKP